MTFRHPTIGRAAGGKGLATPPSNLVADGQAFYENHLKTSLEPSHAGEFVAIEPSAAHYFLGQTATAALIAARNAMPKSQFFLIRIGRNVAHKILTEKLWC